MILLNVIAQECNQGSPSFLTESNADHAVARLSPKGYA
jgi:hypothetical protein